MIPCVKDVESLKKTIDYLQTGDIIIADTAEDESVGKATELLNPNNTAVVSGLHTIPCRPNHAFAPSYLGYYINSKAFHNQLYPFMQGIKVTSISKGNIGKVLISHPRLSEQKKIADLLMLLSGRIEKQRQLVEALKSYKRGVIEALFTHEIRLAPKDNIPYADWTPIAFGSIIKEVSDRTKTENEDILLSAAIDGMFLNSELFDHHRGSSNIGYKKIEKGMLVLSTQNLHLGNANVNLRFEHGIVSPAYKTYKIVGCIPEFLDIWVKREAAKQFFYNATTTGASVCRRNVEWNTLYGQSLQLPCKDEQESIIRVVQPIQSILIKENDILKRLICLKQELLHELFI